MSAISEAEARAKLADGVEKAKPSYLAEFYTELFPESPAPETLAAGDLVRLIRSDLEPEGLVELWNVVFPDDHHVWYNEETNEIHYNEDLGVYVD